VVAFHEYVDGSHVLAPDKIATQPQQPRSRTTLSLWSLIQGCF
jgi:hypothetical protein